MAKKLMAILLVVAILMCGLVGCASDKPAEEEKAPEAAAPETEAPEADDSTDDAAASEGSDLTADLTLWGYPRLENEEFFSGEMMDEFHELYPNVTITATTLPWDGGPEKVNVAIASGTTPDILFDSSLRVNGYAAKGILVPLNEVLAANADNMDPSWFEECAVDGQQYMAPVNTPGTAAMLINMALVEEFGLTDMLPEDHMSWSWDEFNAFVTAAAEAGKSQGIAGIGMFAGSQSSDSNTMSMLMGGGDTIMNADNTEITLNTEASAQVLDNMAALVNNGGAMAGATTLIDDEILDLFLSNKLVVSQYGDLFTVNKAYDMVQNGENLGELDPQYFFFPSLSGEPQKSISYGADGMCIFDNKDEDKIAAAKAFIDFFMDSKWEPTYIETAGQLPCRAGFELYANKPEVAREAARQVEFAANRLSGWGQQLTFWGEIRATFYPEIQAVYSGAKSSMDALNAFAENANKIIAENS